MATRRGQWPETGRGDNLRLPAATVPHRIYDGAAARAHSLGNLEEYDVIETPKKEAKSTGGANGFSFILHEQVATRQFSTGIVSAAHFLDSQVVKT